MSFYDETEVDHLASQIQDSETDYLKNMAKNLGTVLVKNPQYYLNFGVYWWAIKKALWQYYSGQAWFMKQNMDQRILEKCWHGDLFRTCLAGMYYQHTELQMDGDDQHIYLDDEGNTYHYSLYDSDSSL